MNAVQSIVKPLRPGAGLGWRGPLPPPAPVARMGYACEEWRYYDRELSYCVFSAVEVVVDKDGRSNGPEYHLSMSRQTVREVQRCSGAEAAWILDQFRLDGAEEDNHVEHGVVRNFWRTVAEPLIGLECECKASEPRIIEDKGDFVIRP